MAVGGIHTQVTDDSMCDCLPVSEKISVRFLTDIDFHRQTVKCIDLEDDGR